MGEVLHTVVETEPFLRKAKALGLTDADRETIVSAVAADPASTEGEVIASNVRKRRVGGRGQGKSGGYRIAVAYYGPQAPAYILAILSKGDSDIFTPEQKKAMREASNKVSGNIKGRRK